MSAREPDELEAGAAPAVCRLCARAEGEAHRPSCPFVAGQVRRAPSTAVVDVMVESHETTAYGRLGERDGRPRGAAA